jgi:hypothetical protein
MAHEIISLLGSIHHVQLKQGSGRCMSRYAKGWTTPNEV